MRRRPESRPAAGCALAATGVALTIAFGAGAATVTPARVIPGGEVIEAGDLALVAAATPGALSALEDAIGMEARQTLYPGRPVAVGDLRAPALVDRNDLVRLVYARGALTIEVEGRALDRGARGDRVRVMNLSSRLTVIGAVAGSGVVEMGR